MNSNCSAPSIQERTFRRITRLANGTNFPARSPRPSCRRNFTSSTCFRIRAARDCTSGIRKATPPRTFWRAIKRARGFNVLHPIGWDSFGLPAEQYAVKTGQHPRKTTEANIATFKRQIKSLGFSYDWSREIATTDPDYFKWTQWIFLKLYNSWFNPGRRTRPSRLKRWKFRIGLESAEEYPELDPVKGKDFHYIRPQTIDEKKTIAIAIKHRLAYVSEAPVWWCENLGTVLANEEVVDGKSEVGGFPVIRKPMRQWMLRITAYAERLLARPRHD